MRINTRLDDDHARKLEFLHERTGARTSDIIKAAIDLYYREMKQPASDAARLLRDAEFIGCGEAESDLSARYKADGPDRCIPKNRLRNRNRSRVR